MTKLTRFLAVVLALGGLTLAACNKMSPQSQAEMNVEATEETAQNASDINNQAATEAGAALPEFKIPAPQASAQMVLPRNILPPGEPSLEAVGNSLKARLQAAGYDDPGVYRVTNGFALATAMERIAPDGRPFDGAKRWAIDATGLASLTRPLTLAGMMDALVHADPGSYRVTVYVVTNRPVTNSAAPMKSDVARALVVNGVPGLPAAFSKAKFGPDYQVTALIYEFSRTAVGKPAQFSRPSTRSAASQLRLARVLQG